MKAEESYTGVIMLNLDGILNYTNYLKYYKKIAVPQQSAEMLQKIATLILQKEGELPLEDREHLRMIASGQLPEPFYISKEAMNVQV